MEMEINSHQSPSNESEFLLLEKYQELFNKIHHYSSISFVLLLAKDVAILDTLLDTDKNMTSQEIADSGNLKERYTREILASLVCAELVKATRDENGVLIYHLEQSAKNMLAKITNKSDISRPHVFRSCYDNVKQCLPLSGPIGAGYCDAFFDRMTELEQDDLVIDFFLEHVPELKNRLETGIQVLEFGSGLGSLVGKLATKYVNSTFTASEVSTKLLEDMKTKLDHLPNICFEVFDLSALPPNPRKKFDWILMKNTLHVVPHPGESVKFIRQMVAQPAGVLTFIDAVGKGDPLKSVGDTWEATRYARSLFCCIPASFLQSEDSEAYGCCWGRDKAISITEDAGFEVSTFTYRGNQTLFIARPV